MTLEISGWILKKLRKYVIVSSSTIPWHMYSQRTWHSTPGYLFDHVQYCSLCSQFLGNKNYLNVLQLIYSWWIMKMWYTNSVEYHSSVKKNEIMKVAGKWMELGNIILIKHLSCCSFAMKKHPFLVQAKNLIGAFF